MRTAPILVVIQAWSGLIAQTGPFLPQSLARIGATDKAIHGTYADGMRRDNAQVVTHNAGHHQHSTRDTQGWTTYRTGQPAGPDNAQGGTTLRGGDNAQGVRRKTRK